MSIDRERLLREMIEELNAEETEAEAYINDLRAQRHALERRLAREQERLSATVLPEQRADVDLGDVQDGAAAPPRPAPESSTEPANGTADGITDAVRNVLAEAQGPLGPSEVARRVTAAGLPQDGTHSVRGALGYLKRRGEAVTRRRSAWVLLGSRADEAMQASQIDQWDLDSPDDSDSPELSVNGHRPTEEVRF